MRAKAGVISLLMVFAISFSATRSLATAVADFWKCTGKVGGSWSFAQAPSACNASDFGDDVYLRTYYGAVIYQDKQSAATQLPVYMQNLNSVIRDAGYYYYKTRVPKASPQELQGWLHALQATANQESFWSHYRLASDSRFKMMRGDSGHGHGMMQLDDRSHYAQLQQGVGWDLAQNIFAGMDEFYSNWAKATKAPCLSSPQDYRTRARAAWAAYNGGASQLCRFTNTSSTWAANDAGFAAKYDQQAWARYVASIDAPAKVDIVCLAQKQAGCVASGAVATTPTEIAPSPSPVVPSPSEPVGLYVIGDEIQIQKSIYLRAAPGGGQLAVIPAFKSVQVLGSQLIGDRGGRYYQISLLGKAGYFYAGTNQDYSQWAVKVSTVSAPHIVALPGDQIKIAMVGGINLRQTMGGSVLATLKKDETARVVNVVTSQPAGSVYYLVQTPDGKEGYVFSGHLQPQSSVDQWTVVTP
jgi:hypothetical protein